jgi:hypothetical protein
MYRRALVLLALPALWAAPAAAQHTVRGVVTDSLAGRPLAEATVQLVAAGQPARTATTDAEGRFAFEGVAAGPYALGFLHPVLDSLGLEPIGRGVTVGGGPEVRADLAVPSAARMRQAVCGAVEGGAVMGFVRAAKGGAPVEGAAVVGEWAEITLGGGRMTQRTARREVATGPNGGFVLCDVPTQGMVRLRAAAGRDSTDRVDADVAATGFLRRDLYLGEARLAPAAADSLPPVRTGNGRLSGVVRAAQGGAPVAGAQVGVAGGEQTRTNERGEWTLASAPSGTRVLEVRARGYYPEVRPVDIADGAPPVPVTLTQLAVRLAELRVTARRGPRAANNGFEERRRSLGLGRFLTEEDVQRRNPTEMSDLFLTVPGLIRTRDEMGQDIFVMRSTYGSFTGEGSGRCIPAVYLDGQMLANLTTADLDAIVAPHQVAAVEVYTDTQVPPQFQNALAGCGSIVIWTK